MRRPDPLEGLKSSARVVGADRLAETLVNGFDACGEEGVPLSDRQKVLMVRNALMAWDGYAKELDDSAEADALISSLATRSRGAPGS